MIKQIMPTKYIALMLLIVSQSVYAENYESCLTHSSDKYLDVFKNELDKQNIPNIRVEADGKTAICVLPSGEETALKISKKLASKGVGPF